MIVAKQGIPLLSMFTFRRPLVLFFLTLFTAANFAQSAATDEPKGPTLSLNDAIQRALAKNFTVKAQGYDAQIASARVTESLGKFDPILSGSYNDANNTSPRLIDPTTGLRPPADYANTTDYNVNVGGLMPWGMTYQIGTLTNNPRGTFTSFNDNFSTFAGVSGTQPLLRNFGFGATLASVHIAQVNRGLSEWQFRQTVIDTITKVIFAYNDLNFAHAYHRSAVRSRDLAAQLLNENEKRFKTGFTSESEVTSARSRAASREENILLAEQGVREAENGLKQLISDTRNPTLLAEKIVIEEPPPAPIVVVDPVADFRVALENRPDYQEAKLAFKRDGINRRLQRNQLLPQVNLTGSYGYNGLDTDLKTSRQQLKDRDYQSYSWGVVVSVPLTFTTERGRYRAAKLQESQSETLQQQVEQNIVVQVGNAAGNIETVQKRIQATRKARELAQATLNNEVKLLRAGQSSTFFVAQVQEILAGAEVFEARAQSDYHKALADYDRQLGVTLEKLNITLQAPK